ncbi:MAG: putative Ig domain-containing protein, partial [Candidatus Aureabacteria bacterium]|nr:putative Ig domain-containing protein [Candidatus Auribacterota bacterium]
PLYLTTGALPEGTLGEPYRAELQARGGVPPYVWTISEGDPPRGISLDRAQGVLSGTPRRVGSTLLLIQVSDTRGTQDTVELRLHIDTPPLTIVTSSLPRAELDTPYETALDATGGVPPYRWSLSAGTLPDGISVTPAGTLSGTPAGEAGEYEIAVTATDTAAAHAAAALTLSVAAPGGFVVTGLTAAPSDRKVALTWSNPVAENYSRTLIVRSTAGYPSAQEQGTLIYSGTATDFLDRNAENGALYYYAAIPVTANGSAGAVDDGARAAATPQTVGLSGAADPYADAVTGFQPLAQGGFGSGNLSLALGAPQGGGALRGSTHVVSLHARPNDDNSASPPYGGSITLQFTNNIVVDDAGPDFIVFENVFYVGGDPERRWMEPAIVAVSKDGVQFYTFPYDFVPHYTQDGELNAYNPFCYVNADGSSRGFAGITPVYSAGGSPDPRTPSAAGGDAFDLSAIGAARLDWIRYVRITATGDNWLTDSNGDRVRQIRDVGACSGAGSSGFDLDAVCAIHY